MPSDTLVLCALAAVTPPLVWKVYQQTKTKFSVFDAVPAPPSPSWMTGNMSQLFADDVWPFLDHLTDDLGPAVRLRGLFGARQLYVFDPKALQHIVLKDQDIYEESPLPLIFRRLIFGPGLFGTLGEHHRRQRKLLNPVFSIAHMRHLTPIFYDTAHRLCEGVKIQLQTSPAAEVDILAWMSRTALELIGQGGFGHSFDPLVRNEPDPYAEAVKSFMPTSVRIFSWQIVLALYVPFLFLADHYYAVRRVLAHVIPWLPHPGMHDMQVIVDTIDRTSRKIYAEKKRALLAGDDDVQMGVEEKRDLMSVLLRANMEASAEDRLPEEEIIAQMSSLTFAGTDTTSNGLARILHLLCVYPDAQDKLCAELLDARNANGNQDLGYDDLVELPYLDAVCRETLRLHPPVPFIGRQTTQDVVLPCSKPISGVDGSVITAIPVPKGTEVVVGIYSCNRNKDIWGKDAAEWKPERWLGDGVPESVTEAKIPGVYSNLMTFLGGGRACIGFKFSQLEMKVVLSTLLSSFRFSLPKDAGDDIVWVRAGVTYPATRNDMQKPSMNLKMELVQRDF